MLLKATAAPYVSHRLAASLGIHRRGVLSRGRSLALALVVVALVSVLLLFVAVAVFVARAAGPPVIGATFATGVAATSLDLHAEVNPDGASTTFQFEYADAAHYEPAAPDPYSTGAVAPVSPTDVGGGEGDVMVLVPLTGLLPHTLYHYRLVATSTTGTVETPDHSFTTEFTAAGQTLSDSRAWEQVSPVEKHGAQIVLAAGFAVQAAIDGHGVTYTANTPVTSDPHTSSNVNAVISTRRQNGWSSVEPEPVKSLPEAPEPAGDLASLEYPPFPSADLSNEVIEPLPQVKPLSPEATERTLYIWDVATGSYMPLVTPANDETGEPFGGKAGSDWMEFRGGTPDLSHVVFVSPFALTSEAHKPPDLPICEKNEPCNGEKNLYEWAAGRLQLVNVLPSGQPTVSVFLGRGEPGAYGVHAVSSEGRWIVWTHETKTGFTVPTLYVRDMVEEKTYQVGLPGAAYQTMSSDGSRVFYLEGGDLHVLDTATGAQSDITAAHGAEPNAGVQDAILGASEDGSYLYIVAHGVLEGMHPNTAGEVAVSGKPNLYELHNTGSGWSPTYIATLSTEDEHDWSAITRPIEPYLDLRKITSHVSPDGRRLAFMSDRSLTGYDNVDARSGMADEEVFLFDAATERLVCASCNPTGERPHGILDEGDHGAKTFADPEGAWEGHWVAASMPGWHPFRGGYPMYEPRVLMDSGRLFFQSPDALMSQDSNGREDVYEYEPPGVGTCTEQSPTYSSASAGCVSLISSGTSSQESVFYDASQSGNDVFFSTSSQLAWTDIDEATDVYDARVDGGFPEPIKPPACEGDACQGTAISPIDETPSSITFHGPSNLRTTNVAPARCRKGFIRRNEHCVKAARKRRKSKRAHRAGHKRGRVAFSSRRGGRR